ncbi:MAG TPA: phage tail protein [Pseudomonas sp.]|uniref:phage tail protein n=1 Tax=Pseudomonas sp. TaxID=306 RepID=UPI002CDDDD5C|nr:phage tail protein [Pseudomonas sp.]HWH88181.1 phage tail protein [Pseudomonas sp.]
MADEEKKVKTPVLITGFDELSPKLGALRARIEGFRKNLEQTGLGKLDVSGLFNGGSVITPFVEGIKSAAAFQGQLSEVSDTAKTVDLPAAPKAAAQTMNVFSASMQTVSTAVNAALVPAVGAVVVGLEPMLTGVGTLLADNPELVQGLAAGAIAFSAMQTAVTGATQVFDVMSLVMKANPIMLIATGIALAAGLIVANWKPVSTFFSGLWQRIAPVVIPMAEFFRTMFGYTPLGMLISNWGPVTAFFATLWDGVKAVSVPVIEFFKTWFDYSPQGLILNNWGPLVGLFSSIWDLLRAVSVPVQAFLRQFFDWSPLEVIQAIWGGVVSVFTTIWDYIKLPFLATYAIIREQLGWSPLEKIIENWAPVTAWIEKWAQKFQDAIAPIKAFFNGGFGELIADAKARVDVFTQAQLKTNAEGKGELAPVFFQSSSESSSSTVMTSETLPGKSPMHSGSLSQTSNTLIQQSAANNRTQLEGGLTVRFENAPAGLRTDPPQTNQPGLALSSRIGYRSLSAGGSNELA